MIHIQKHSPPNKFVKFVQQNKNAHFDDMPSEVKQILRDSLLKEQGYLCAYCMSRIDNKEITNVRQIEQDTEVKQDTKIEQHIKIEHYVSRNNENELDYKNLLAVCGGNSGGNDEKHQHCDTKKGNKTLKINPQNKCHISQISYESDGTIYSRNEEFNYDLNVTLNLNDDEGYLKNNRKTALNALKKEIKQVKDKLKDKVKNKNEILEHLREYLRQALDRFTNLNKDGKLIPYCGIVIEFLEKKINEYGTNNFYLLKT